MNKTQIRMADLELEELIEEYAPQLQRSQNGNTYHGLCPFPSHNDKSPSFGISAEVGHENGTWVCSCGKGMFPQFVMNMENCSFKEAMKIIEKKTGLSETSDNISRYLKFTMRKMEDAPKPKDVEYEKITLRKGREDVLKYLTEKRRYSVEEGNRVADQFKMCVSNDYPVKDWVIIPVYDDGGKRVISWYGTRPKDGRKYNGSNSVRGMCFNVHECRGSSWSGNGVIVVESIWCVVRLWSYGYPAISTFGARIDAEQAKKLIDNFQNIYLCFDNDEAGLRATGRAIKLMTPQRNVFTIHQSLENDPDKSTKEQIEKALKKPIRV